MPKNPHAVALGRMGGKKTGRKGFAAMSKGRGDEIRAKGLLTRKLNRDLEKATKEKLGYLGMPEIRRVDEEIETSGPVRIIIRNGKRL